MRPRPSCGRRSPRRPTRSRRSRRPDASNPGDGRTEPPSSQQPGGPSRPAAPNPGGAVGSELLFVNGTLMRGLALHANLDGAEFVEEAQTAPSYRIHSIGDIHPGMYHVADGGISVPGEIYR